MTLDPAGLLMLALVVYIAWAVLSDTRKARERAADERFRRDGPCWRK